MIKFFREARSVVSMSNVRITEIKNVFQGLMTEISVIDVSAKKKGKMSPSQNV